MPWNAFHHHERLHHHQAAQNLKSAPNKTTAYKYTVLSSNSGWCSARSQKWEDCVRISTSIGSRKASASVLPLPFYTLYTPTWTIANEKLPYFADSPGVKKNPAPQNWRKDANKMPWSEKYALSYFQEVAGPHFQLFWGYTEILLTVEESWQCRSRDRENGLTGYNWFFASPFL